MSLRKIKIYTTTGIKGKEITTDATTYGALKPTLRENNISLENMDVVIAGSNTSLEMDSASLPDGDFVLYFNPRAKIKSGEVSRNEIYAFIKANPTLKDKFAKDGRNYTQVTTADLQAIYAKVSKEGNKVTATPVAKTSNKSESKKEVAKATPVAKKVSQPSNNSINSSEIIEDLDNLYNKIQECDESDFEDEKDDILEMINITKSRLQTSTLVSNSSNATSSEDDEHLANMKRLFGK